MSDWNRRDFIKTLGMTGWRLPTDAIQYAKRQPPEISASVFPGIWPMKVWRMFWITCREGLAPIHLHV